MNFFSKKLKKKFARFLLNLCDKKQKTEKYDSKNSKN